MEPLLECCAGLDVHRDTVVATVRTPDGAGGRRVVTETFAVTTPTLLALRDWLQAQRVTHVALESTGVYWKPIYYVLEDAFTLILVNMQHLRHVPGRKSDVRDSEWLAQLLECGLLRGSFIPPSPIRDLRDLTRYRRAQIAITTPRLSASTFASTLVLSRTDPCPAAELSRRLERRHVGTGFCDDDFGRPPLNTRNGGEPLQDRCKGHQQAVDLGGAIANGVLDDGDLVEDLRSQEGMVRSKSSLQSCSEGWQLRPKFATRQVGQQRRISGPFDQRSDDGTT